MPSCPQDCLETIAAVPEPGDTALAAACCSSQHQWADGAGIGASVACAAHCAAMPFAVTLLPLLGMEFLLNPMAEWALLVGMAALAVASLGWGFRKHRSLHPFAPLVTGIGLLIFAHGRGVCCDGHVRWDHVTPAVLGGLLIAVSHWANLTLCRQCPKCSCCSE